MCTNGSVEGMVPPLVSTGHPKEEVIMSMYS